MGLQPLHLWQPDEVRELGEPREPGESTGRFAGVTGSWIMYAYSEPFVLGSDDPAVYRWHGEGSLAFREGKP